MNGLRTAPKIAATNATPNRAAAMLPHFAEFECACHWIDEHTSPETAGAFVIVETANGYAIEPFRQPENHLPATRKIEHESTSRN